MSMRLDFFSSRNLFNSSSLLLNLFSISTCCVRFSLAFTMFCWSSVFRSSRLLHSWEISSLFSLISSTSVLNCPTSLSKRLMSLVLCSMLPSSLSRRRWRSFFWVFCSLILWYLDVRCCLISSMAASSFANSDSCSKSVSCKDCNKAFVSSILAVMALYSWVATVISSPSICFW